MSTSHESARRLAWVGAALTVLLTTGCAQQSLQTKLDARQAEWARDAPPDRQQAYDQGVVEVGQSGVMERARRVGEEAPDFVLPAASGAPVRLDELLQDGPVVLVWYRGGWCPYCNLTLQEYQAWLPKIRAHDAQVVAISPERPQFAVSTKQSNTLDFAVVSDEGNRVARKFGIVYTLPVVVQEQFAGRLDLAKYNGDASQELPLAATYVIDRDGVIRYAFLDEDYRRRAEPADVVAALKALDS